ncbi:MAG: hypothetical protein AMJ73_10080 [candidate division Zixibacteria bacterium SM1_73]|nr:MAG: hypothetical protein AMJ73_10080 [candidate division Zixibacteria bacterium SM1_73]
MPLKKIGELKIRCKNKDCKFYHPKNLSLACMWLLFNVNNKKREIVLWCGNYKANKEVKEDGPF